MSRHGGDPRAFGFRPGELLDFSANLNPLGPPPAALGAARRAPVDAYPEPYAKTLAAAIEGRERLPAGSVAVGAGAVELIHLLARQAARRVARLCVPTFSEYRVALEAQGARIETARDPDRLAGDVAFLCNPNNPTGTLLPPGEVLRLADGCRLLVVDESLIDFVPDPAASSVAREAAGRPGLWVLRSLTKWYAMPGLRVGYAVGRPDAVAELDRRRDPWSVGAPAQAAALAAIGDREHDRRTRAWVTAARPALYAALRSLAGYDPLPPAANFILVRGSTDARALRARLLTQGILIRGPEGFESLTPDHFRVAVRTREDNRRLVQTLGSI